MWRCLVLLWCLVGNACLAGPWAREKGTFFVSTGMNTDPAASVYVEYGLGNNWTVGLDAYGTWTYTGNAAVFASQSFALPQGVMVGLETAIVMRSDGFVPLDPLGETWGLALKGPDMRLGASMGRGLDVMSGGWATASSSMILGDPLTQKFDLTFGVSPTKRTKVYGQLQGARTAWGQVWRAEAVAGFELRKGNEFLLNCNIPFGAGDTRLGLTLWQTF